MSKSPEMSSISVKLDYKKSCYDNFHESSKLVVECWEGKTVQDFKSIIQETLNIPTCDQILFYPQGNLLTDNSLKLTSLYLRDGDHLFLEYLSVINIKGMDQLIQDLKEFSQSISNWEENNMFDLSSKEALLIPNYEIITRATEKLAFEFFIPWKNSVSVAQRHYFVQEGAFDEFLKVFKFAEHRYRCTNPHNQSQWMEDDLQDNTLTMWQIVDHYNNEQMVLQMHCLSLLWNFSETSVDRAHVLEHNGLEMTCNALLLDPTAYDTDDSTFWVINSIHETAVGCLVQYAEFPKAQDTLANSKPTVDKLTYMVETRLIRETSFYSLYSCQIAANTLFLCACNVRSPVVLAENKVHVRLINLTKILLENDHDMALRYYCCLFLARIIACPLLQLQHDVVEQVDKLLQMFMSKHTPEEVSQFEERHNYVWISLLPFLSLAFCGGPPCDTCTKWPGTRVVQQMGLFCIDHMLRMKENCLLIVKEKLLPYLTCLEWQLNDTNREILHSCFQRLPISGPPSLAVIAKSQLARMRGLEMAISLR